MNILLDTHIWLWFLAGDKRLSTSLKRALSNKKNSLWLSPISVWEALILAQKGKIRCVPDGRAWVRNALSSLETREAALTTEIAIRSREVMSFHEDPADRFLVATALEMRLRLATADERILEAEIKGLELLP